MQESGKAAVFLNECADSGNQNCNHTSFKHPCGTGAHIAKQIGWRNHAGCNHDNRAADDTDNQYKEHIQSHDAANQYQNIGNGLNQVIFFRNKAAIIAFYGKNKNNDYADNRRRQGDKEIFLKFICHFTALPVAGSNGCIRNKGQVIPEHCTAHDRSNAKRHGKAGGLCNGNADGDNQRNCADRGAHGERYKTADDEKHRNRELRRNQRENEVGNAVCGGSADNADKNPCQHEDENHRDNIRVADAGAHNGKLIIERQGAVLQTGNKQGNQKYDNNRDFVKAHFDAQAIFKQYAKT